MRAALSLTAALCLFIAGASPPPYPQSSPQPSATAPGAALLKPGDALPSLSGQALNGKLLDLPQAAHGKVAIVIFSFSRAGGRDAQAWAEHLSADDPHTSVYNVIFLESVPRVVRFIAVSSIRSQMPSTMHPHTLLLYQQQADWKQRLKLSDETQARVLVLGPEGHIRWQSAGPFEQSQLLHAREQADRPAN